MESFSAIHRLVDLQFPARKIVVGSLLIILDLTANGIAIQFFFQLDQMFVVWR